MRKGFIVSGLLSAILLAACEGVPTAERSPITPTFKENVVLDGDLTKTLSNEGHPQFEGFIKNIGNKTVYNCAVEISCYYTYSKSPESLIDIAKGYPAENGDIPPGARVGFVAVASRLTSHSQIRETSVLITWFEK